MANNSFELTTEIEIDARPELVFKFFTDPDPWRKKGETS